MRALFAGEIVLAWEAGQEKHPVDRALLLLAQACPEMSSTELSNLTIGQRNSLLLSLRQQMLGAIANCCVKCPQCNEQLEFPLDLEALRQLRPSEPDEKGNTLTVDGFHLRFRLPNSFDLAAVVGSGNVSAGTKGESRQLLLERCVEQAEHDGEAVAVASLPEHVVLALADAMSERDPQAEITIGLNCPACEHTWATVFDIVSFFWTEIETQAKRLLLEVHTLASAYGWRESDVFALSTTRRQFYLELIR